MTARKKTVLIILPSAAVLLAIAAYFCFRAPAEPPLPPEQQIRHDFRKAFDPEESTLDRLYSLRRSFKEVRGLPADRRHRIMVEALAGAMDSTLQDFAQLPQDQKQERAELLRKDAERTLAYFRKLPQEKQRKAVAVLMNTEEGRAKFNQAVNTTTNRTLDEAEIVLHFTGVADHDRNHRLACGNSFSGHEPSPRLGKTYFMHEQPQTDRHWTGTVRSGILLPSADLRRFTGPRRRTSGHGSPEPPSFQQPEDILLSVRSARGDAGKRQLRLEHSRKRAANG